MRDMVGVSGMLMFNTRVTALGLPRQTSAIETWSLWQNNPVFDSFAKPCSTACSPVAIQFVNQAREARIARAGLNACPVHLHVGLQDATLRLQLIAMGTHVSPPNVCCQAFPMQRRD